MGILWVRQTTVAVDIDARGPPRIGPQRKSVRVRARQLFGKGTERNKTRIIVKTKKQQDIRVCAVDDPLDGQDLLVFGPHDIAQEKAGTIAFKVGVIDGET